MASKATATTVSQLSCFSSINRRLQHRRQSIIHFSNSRSRLPIVMTLERPGADFTSPEIKRPTTFADESTLHDETSKLHPSIGTTAPEHGTIPQKKTAKIHDFCLGIPFGALIFSGGLVGFILSRNPRTLSTGMLFGGALLALSTSSLKIWRKGKSSLPFILGQAALSAALLWKNLKTYSLTKKVLPAGFLVLVSAAIICFYSYVIISGGNPPPKKLKPTIDAAY